MSERNQVERAALQAAGAKESGAWLHAVPVPCLSTHLDPETLRIAVALRLGGRICEPHSCRCGAQIDGYGHHGLSCRLSAGRHSRHAELNDIVKRALVKCGVPSVLEPLGMDRNDGRRPDGVTMFPYKLGRSLVWDATCVDTFSRGHIIASALEPGGAAAEAERLKCTKYADLAERYIFQPIAVETAGTFGPSTLKAVEELGRKLAGATGEPRETLWLKQRLNIAVIRGNAASIRLAARVVDG